MAEYPAIHKQHIKSSVKQTGECLKNGETSENGKDQFMWIKTSSFISGRVKTDAQVVRPIQNGRSVVGQRCLFP